MNKDAQENRKERLTRGGIAAGARFLIFEITPEDVQLQLYHVDRIDLEYLQSLKQRPPNPRVQFSSSRVVLPPAGAVRLAFLAQTDVPSANAVSPRVQNVVYCGISSKLNVDRVATQNEIIVAETC